MESKFKNLKGMATAKQIALLIKLGVNTNRNFTKQDASDAITKALDSRKGKQILDKYRGQKKYEQTVLEIVTGFSCTHDSPHPEDGSSYYEYDDSESDRRNADFRMAVIRGEIDPADHAEADEFEDMRRRYREEHGDEDY